MACLLDPETEAARQQEAKDAERLKVARQLSRQDSYQCHRLSKVADSTYSIISATTTMSVYVSLHYYLFKEHKKQTNENNNEDEVCNQTSPYDE